MKKFFTLCLLVVAASLHAQDIDETFQFITADGTVVPNGSTVTVSDLVEDEFLGNFIPTGLFVKNTTDDASTMVRVKYDIEELPNGSFQICFPITCQSKDAIGTYYSSSGSLPASEPVDLQCEWFPEAYGTCKATLQLELMMRTGTFPNFREEKVADGPTINLVFNYVDPAGVSTLSLDDASVDAVYTADGRSLSSLRKGLNIVRMTDGKTIKRFVK